MARNVVSVDFSNVKESSGINPKHQDEGDYLMRIVRADLGKSKADKPQIVILFQDVNMRSATYPYYCGLEENQLWKLRNVLIASGLPVPKSKGKIDLDKLINREVGVTLEDNEFNGRVNSAVTAVMHKDELEPTVGDDEDFEDEEDEEVEEEEAPASKAKRKAAPAPVEEDEEEEDDLDLDDEEEEEEPAPAPKRKAKAKPAPVVEDDDEDEDDDLDLD